MSHYSISIDKADLCYFATNSIILEFSRLELIDLLSVIYINTSNGTSFASRFPGQLFLHPMSAEFCLYLY